MSPNSPTAQTATDKYPPPSRSHSSEGEPGFDMDARAILMAVEERRRWEQRRTELLAELRAMPVRERRRRTGDLQRIDHMLAYYDALVRDMKRKVQRGTSVNTFLDRFGASE